MILHCPELMAFFFSSFGITFFFIQCRTFNKVLQITQLFWLYSDDRLGYFLCVVNTVAAANHKYRVRRKYDRIPFNHRPDVSVSFHFLFLRVPIHICLWLLINYLTIVFTDFSVFFRMENYSMARVYNIDSIYSEPSINSFFSFQIFNFFGLLWMKFIVANFSRMPCSPATSQPLPHSLIICKIKEESFQRCVSS